MCHGEHDMWVRILPLKIKDVIIIRKYKWWEYPFPNMDGIYRFNPFLLGEICGGVTAMVLYLLFNVFVR